MPQSRAQKRKQAPLQSTPYDHLLCFNLYRGWRGIQELYGTVFPENFNAQRSYVIGLCRDGAVTVSEIAAVLQIDDAAVSNLIKRMEKDGLVTRQRSSHDRRSFEIQATPQGAQVAEETTSKLQRLDEGLFERLSRNDIDVLRRIVTAIQQEPQHPVGTE